MSKYALLILYLLAICANAPAAPLAAYAFTAAPETVDDPLSLGFEFRTTDSVTISALGYYDSGGDGLSVAHEVGLFDSVGTLLAAITVAAGTSDPLIGNFRYAAITPLTLAAGECFTIAATTGGSADGWAYGIIGDSISGFSSHPAIEISPSAGVFVYTPDSQLHYPTNHFRYSLYAGPNFLIQQRDAAAVPEPASGALLIFAMAAVFVARRKALATE